MKKIVLCNVPMQKVESVRYGNTGNAEVKYDGKVIYPINAVLADRLKKSDEVKVILMKKKSKDFKEQQDINAEKFKKELNDINENIGATISYVEIESDFEETRENHQKILIDIIENIDDEVSMFVDITYGPKPVPMIAMCALAFADKFFRVNVDTIVYGKVDMKKDPEKYGDEIAHPENPELFDVSFLYYLNNLTEAIDAPSREAAIDVLKKFLD